MSHTSFPGSFGKSVTVAAIRHGHTGHNKPLRARKKVERLEKTVKDRDWGDTCTEVKSKETLQTQTPEMANVVYVRGQHIHTWRELTGYRAVARFCHSWIEIGHSTKGSFSPASGFALVNLWWSHAGIEIPYPALFPLTISHPNPIKTRNPAPTSNWNSRFPPLYSAQIPNITAKKKPNPASRQTYWGPSVIWVSLRWLWHLCNSLYAIALFWLISIARYVFKSPSVCFEGQNICPPTFFFGDALAFLGESYTLV